MSHKLAQICAVAAVMAVGGTTGFLTVQALAAAEDARLATTTSMAEGKVLAVSQGETPEAMAIAAKLGVTAYEADNEVGGHGAPQKILIDNDVVRVNLVAFKKDFKRSGGMKRRYDQLLVYVDQGAYTLLTANGKAIENPPSHKVAPGSSVFHRRESVLNDTRIDQDYRVLFIEMKK